jgi:Amt family ammonium transporter
MLVEWALKGKPTVVGICSVRLPAWWPLPASGFRRPVGAFAIRIGAGVLCYGDARA